MMPRGRSAWVQMKLTPNDIPNLIAVASLPAFFPSATGTVHATTTRDGVDSTDFSVAPQESCIFLPQAMGSIDS